MFVIIKINIKKINMNKELKEKDILLIIKYTPIFVIFGVYLILSIFLIINHYELFQTYIKEFILTMFLILFISLSISFYITNKLKKSFLKYTLGIKEEIKKNREKDFLLYQESKLATIGELLGSISHQWRQPLNVITICASGIKLQIESKNIEKNKELELLTNIVKNANYLSKTIDDFRDFYIPNNSKNNFFIINSINKSIDFINLELTNRNIKIRKNFKEFQLNGFENQLEQVIINILNNSIDKFDESEIENKIIDIETYQENNYCVLQIRDNAGGINSSIIEKIFEPYFTTKEQKRGVGISLYISHQIIVKSFKGTINVENQKINYLNKNYNCACFKIKIPLLN